MVGSHRPVLFALAMALLAAIIGASPVAAGTEIIVRYGDRTQKRIALTFDDGWSATRTAQIVAILDNKNVKATFLPYARAARYSPDLWRSIATRYPIANHTKTHPYMTRLSYSEMYTEIDSARRIMEKITGQRMVRMFRPPYGARNSTVDRAAYNAGFKTTVLWDVDSGDSWGRLTDTQVYKQAIGGRNGSIILMHAGPGVTVRVLPKVIRYYRERGYSFVTLPRLLGW
jgi:peptidoglycan-N-acetylglucosamine deacetylase